MLFKRFLDLAVNLDINGNFLPGFQSFRRAVEWDLVALSWSNRSAQDQARLDVGSFRGFLTQSVGEI